MDRNRAGGSGISSDENTTAASGSARFQRSVYLIAIGLMMAWTAPVILDGPSVKKDSHA